MKILQDSDFAKQQSEKAAKAYQEFMKTYQHNPKDCPVFQKHQITSLLSGLAKQGEKF